MYRKSFLRFFAEIWPEKITSRDGCVLLIFGRVKFETASFLASSGWNGTTRQESSQNELFSDQALLKCRNSCPFWAILGPETAHKSTLASDCLRCLARQRGAQGLQGCVSQARHTARQTRSVLALCPADCKRQEAARPSRSAQWDSTEAEMRSAMTDHITKLMTNILD